MKQSAASAVHHRCASLAALLALASCSVAPPFPVETMVQEWAAYMNSDHVLVPGDQLTISAFDNESLTQEVTVSPSGVVTLRRLPGSLRAAGRTVSEFRGAVEQAYEEILTGVELSINLTNPNPATVFVAGEVYNPGPVPWTSSLTIAQAVSAAGGFQITAKPTDVLVVRKEPASGAPRTVRVNVDAILYGKSPDFPVLPGDVVWCQTSGIADAGNWVELYIRRLLPIGVTGAAIPIEGN